MNDREKTATGILDSAADEYRSINLGSVDSVQAYSESCTPSGLSYDDAERVWNACRSYLRAGETAQDFHNLITEPLRS